MMTGNANKSSNTRNGWSWIADGLASLGLCKSSGFKGMG